MIKTRILTSLIMSIVGVLLSSNTLAGSAGVGTGDHSHSAVKAKPACTAEHAAMGHCEMEKASSHGHGSMDHGSAHGHSHDSMDHGSASSVGMPVGSNKATQVVKVDMLDSMRFVFNDEFVIKSGKVIQFQVTNKGKIRHEFSIGNLSEQESHAKIMMANPSMDHGDGEAAITVDAGETKTLTWSFDGNEEVVFACTLPGHYQAGMYHKQTMIN